MKIKNDLSETSKIFINQGVQTKINKKTDSQTTSQPSKDIKYDRAQRDLE